MVEIYIPEGEPSLTIAVGGGTFELMPGKRMTIPAKETVSIDCKIVEMRFVYPADLDDDLVEEVEEADSEGGGDDGDDGGEGLPIAA